MKALIILVVALPVFSYAQESALTCNVNHINEDEVEFSVKIPQETIDLQGRVKLAAFRDLVEKKAFPAFQNLPENNSIITDRQILEKRYESDSWFGMKYVQTKLEPISHAERIIKDSETDKNEEARKKELLNLIDSATSFSYNKDNRILTLKHKSTDKESLTTIHFDRPLLLNPVENTEAIKVADGIQIRKIDRINDGQEIKRNPAVGEIESQDTQTALICDPSQVYVQKTEKKQFQIMDWTKTTLNTVTIKK